MQYPTICSAQGVSMVLVRRAACHPPLCHEEGLQLAASLPQDSADAHLSVHSDRQAMASSGGNNRDASEAAAVAEDDDIRVERPLATAVAGYDLDLDAVLGRSAFSTVLQGRHREDGSLAAIKAIALVPQNTVGYASELRIHKLVSGHRFLVSLLEHSVTPDFVYLVLEHCSGGDVFQRIVPHVGLGQRELVGIYFAQLVEAIDFLHTKGIAHLDVKPENMLVTGDQIKLGDFGLSVLIEDGPVSDCRGSFSYASPENIKCYRRPPGERNYDPAKADIWSCGIVLFVLMFGHTPWNAARESSLEYRLYKSTDGYPNSKPWNCMSTIRNVFRRTLSISPNQRFSSSELKHHLSHSMGWTADQRIPLKSPVASPRRSLSRRFSGLSDFS
eukprot:m.34808 g.34808  ORF g.34808 m.34808 type:complete len:387 (-) comp5692_c1_seq1:158-1318(-)